LLTILSLEPSLLVGKRKDPYSEKMAPNKGIARQRLSQRPREISIITIKASLVLSGDEKNAKVAVTNTMITEYMVCITPIRSGRSMICFYGLFLDESSINIRLVNYRSNYLSVMC
jgi:hypothetical protein